MGRVEPVPDEPAAVLTPETGARRGDRLLAVADYHAGIEAGLRYERGVELDSDAEARLDRLLALVERTGVDGVVVLGDLAHRIGDPDGPERDELDTLVERVTDRVPLTLVVGNHDAGLAERYGDRLSVVDGAGGRIGDVGVVHGHTWPDPAVLSCSVVCMGHEHPRVKLTDTVGGGREERAWLRGSLDPAPFVESGRYPDLADGGETDDGAADGDDAGNTGWGAPELVVFPAFNDRSGGTRLNAANESFLSPFLPDGVERGDVYLLDGTRLGDFRRLS